MKQSTAPARGFTIPELLTVVAVIAVLTAIGITVYGHYADRARSAEIIGKYDAIRTGAILTARARAGAADDCTEVIKALDGANLADRNATLSYGFEAVKGGYRPVLGVCAQAGQHGAGGVHTAREVHETLARNNMVEKSPVLTDSLVSFALRLTEGEAPLCKVYRPQPVSTACAPTPPPLVAQGGTGTTQPPAGGTAVAPQGPAQTTPTQVATVQPGNQAPGSGTPQQPPQQPNQPPSQSGSQTPPQQPATGPSTAQSTPRPPATGGAGAIDTVAIASGLENHYEMGFLNKRDQEMVANVAVMMATNVQYAMVVKAAISQVPSRRPVDVPTSVQAVNTTPFSGEMHRVLEIIFPEAARRVCLARGTDPARCG